MDFSNKMLFLIYSNTVKWKILIKELSFSFKLDHKSNSLNAPWKDLATKMLVKIFSEVEPR